MAAVGRRRPRSVAPALLTLLLAAGARLAGATAGTVAAPGILPETTTTTTSTATSSTTTTSTAVTTPTTVDASSLRAVDMPAWWPSGWGAVQWSAILVPLAVLLLIICYMYAQRRIGFCSRDRRLVRVVPVPFDDVEGGASASFCDFSKMGPLSVRQLRATEEVLAGAVRGGRGMGGPPQRCVLAFGPENRLGSEHLAIVGELLERHPAACLQLDVDWSRADDKALLALGPLLARHRSGRCRFGTPGTRLFAAEAQGALRLPASAQPAALEAVAEALSLAARAEVDAIVLCPGKKAKHDEEVELGLAQLRLSCQELTLSRRALGDAGGVAACAFVRPWAGRLQIARLMECQLGDGGAAAVARLLRGGGGAQPSRAGDLGGSGGASLSLRELTLTANHIGDKGAVALAEALPRCDVLERLLLDRNQIGQAGAAALARHLPRSALKELVLGSHLGGNPVGPAGAEALAAALDDELPRAAADRPWRLGALALDDCGVGEQGAKAFARALPRSALFALSLARGHVGSDGVKAVLVALPPSMVSLDLSCNGVADSAASAAGEVLYKMPQLVVSLAQSGVTPALAALLREEHGARLRL